MRILITGIGEAFSKYHYGSSALVEAPTGYVLIDCPDPIHRVLHEATTRAGWRVGVGEIDDIIITHLHGDHCNGLEMFGFHRRLMRAGDPFMIRPRVHVSPPVSKRLWEKLAPSMEKPGGEQGGRKLDDFFELRVIRPEEPAQIAGLTVRCRYTGHPVPTIGLVLHDGGKSLGWSADTPFEQAHIDWLNQADLIVHETSHGPTHTPIQSLNALPDPVRRKMRLIHLPDDFDPSCTDIAPLREGEVICL